jgi:hypothetical protein
VNNERMRRSTFVGAMPHPSFFIPDLAIALVTRQFPLRRILLLWYSCNAMIQVSPHRGRWHFMGVLRERAWYLTISNKNG